MHMPPTQLSLSLWLQKSVSGVPNDFRVLDPKHENWEFLIVLTVILSVLLTFHFIVVLSRQSCTQSIKRQVCRWALHQPPVSLCYFTAVGAWTPIEKDHVNVCQQNIIYRKFCLNLRWVCQELKLYKNGAVYPCVAILEWILLTCPLLGEMGEHSVL